MQTVLIAFGIGVLVGAVAGLAIAFKNPWVAAKVAAGLAAAKDKVEQATK